MLKNKRFLCLFKAIIILLLINAICIYSQTNDEQIFKINNLLKATEEMKNELTPYSEKISSDLIQVMIIYEESQKKGILLKNNLKEYSRSGFFIDDNERILVYVYLVYGAGSEINFIKSEIVNMGGEIYYSTEEGNSYSASLYCWLKPNNLINLARNENVKYISNTHGCRTRSANVISVGDTHLVANVARERFSVNGSGVKIGVISDGVKNLSQVKARGELQYVSVIDTGDVTGNEGTAMLEIIHDLAPQSQLYFAGLKPTDGPEVMADRINSLWNYCRIIVDDIYFPSEPFFSDQTALGSAVRNFLNYYHNNYVSAAGNQFKQVHNSTLNVIGNVHYFTAWDTLIEFILPARKSTTVALQWAENWQYPFTDLDLFIYKIRNNNLVLWDYSVNNQQPNFPPSEIINNLVDLTDQIPDTFKIKIKWKSGSQNNLEFAILVTDAELSNSGNKHIFGHAAYPGVVSVAAYHFDNQNNIASYSSRGQSTMYVSYPTGQWTTQNTPTITATSKVKTYVGTSVYNYWPPGNPYFTGTSAAAPHIAALAGLYYHCFQSNTGQDFYNHLTSSATTIGSIGVGGHYNSTSGYGRANAYELLIKGLQVINNPIVNTNTSWDGVRIIGTAQINNGAQVLISSGKVCVIDGTLIFNSGRIDVWGTLIVRKNSDVDTDFMYEQGSGKIIFEDTYRKVRIKQVDANDISFGEFGKLTRGSFKYFSERDFLWRDNSAQTLQANQGYKPGTTQKYNNWNASNNVVNHKSFSITSLTNELKSKFLPTINTITMMNECVEGGTGGYIEFKDPWLIDKQVNVGNELVWQNRGQDSAIWYQKDSPFEIWKPEHSNYKGVFLNQAPITNPPYYTVRVPQSQNIGGYNANFATWTATGQTQVTNPLMLESPVIFKGANDIVKAIYKGHMLSSISTATGPNNQRKVLETSIYKHLVYVSGGKVWYSRYDGTQWLPEVLISSHTSNNARNPSISENYPWLYFVWEDGPPNCVSHAYYRKGDIYGMGYSPIIQVSDDNCCVGDITPIVGGGGVVIWSRNDFLGDQLWIRHVDHYQGLQNIYPIGYGIKPGLQSSFNGYNLVSEENGQIYYTNFTTDINGVPNFVSGKLVSETMTNCANPSIAVNYDGRVFIAWQAVTANGTRIFLRERNPSNVWLGIVEFGHGVHSTSNPTIGVDAINNKVILSWQCDTHIAKRMRDISSSTWGHLTNMGQGSGPSVTQYNTSIPLITWTSGSSAPYSINVYNLTSPPTPVQLTPTNGQQNVGLGSWLVWNSSFDAERYHIQVSTDQYFSNLVCNSSDITTTSFQPGNLNYSTWYYWRVSATNNYGTSNWSQVWFFRTVNSPPLGCPFVYTWNGEVWVEDNNILPQSEYSENQNIDVTDYYQLFTKPKLESAEGGEKYRLAVGEFEQERSYIDQFKLLVIDHPNETLITVNDSGRVIQFAKPAYFASAALDSEDVYKQLYELDGLKTKAAVGDTLKLSFEESTVGIDKYVLLIAQVQAAAKEKIAGEVLTGSGKEKETFTSFRLRRNPSYQWVSVPEGNSSSIQVDIVWKGEAEVDYTELSHKLELPFTLYTPQLLRARHSNLGDVTDMLRNWDENYAELNPNELIDLEFSAPPIIEGMQRSFVFVSRGRYERIAKSKESDAGGLAIKKQQATSSTGPNIPTKYALHQNHPNPFNPVTIIRYELPEVSNVVLKIYDILGKEVATLVNGMQDAGYKHVVFDASSAAGGLTSGIYLYKLVASSIEPLTVSNFTDVKKLVLVK